MIYLMIKELRVGSDESLIVISCLSKDMTSKTDLFRANSIRVLAKIVDVWGINLCMWRVVSSAQTSKYHADVLFSGAVRGVVPGLDVGPNRSIPEAGYCGQEPIHHELCTSCDTSFIQNWSVFV